MFHRSSQILLMTDRLDLTKVRKLADDGNSISEIATRLGAKYHTVCQAMKRNGIVAVPAKAGKGRRKKLEQGEIEEMIAAFEQGATYDALCVQYGITRSAVDWHVRRVRKQLAQLPFNADAFDRQIIVALDALTKKLGLSAQEVAERVTKLQQEGRLRLDEAVTALMSL